MNTEQMTDSEIASLVDNLKHSQTAYGWINRQNQKAAKAIEQLQAALQAKRVPTLSDDEFAALYRCDQTMGDDNSYDIDATMMQKLADCGAVWHKGGGYYAITKFGNYLLKTENGSIAAPQPQADKVRELEMVWHPIDTAPKDNKRPLFIARFNDDGTMQSFDYDATWESERESWEMPQVYYYLASANGNVEEPTHWCYEPEGFSRLSDDAIDEADKMLELEAKILDLPRYSFLSPKEGGVRRCGDKSGAWIERCEVIKLLEAMKEANQ